MSKPSDLRARYDFYVGALQSLKAQLMTTSNQCHDDGEEDAKAKFKAAADALQPFITEFQDSSAVCVDVS